MHETTPVVHLIAQPLVDTDEIEAYLGSLGASDWMMEYLDADESHGNFDGDLLGEVAGRLCYQSWAPGINPNVTKVRSDHREYLGNILKQRHGAVLEHAQYTFIFENVSRVFTHELVRHRVGVAISQESLRYVRLTDLGFRVPDLLADHAAWAHEDGQGRTLGDKAMKLISRMEDFQRDAAEAFGLDDPGVPFHFKKEVTSALRRWAPIGLSTNIVWSANIRTLRHTIALRTDPGAEEEIRLVFAQLADTMQNVAPYAFQDMTVGEDSLHRVFDNWKV